MRWKVICAYDGTDFRGWQSQIQGGTVQDTIEKGLLQIFHKKIRIHGSGRTDSGVHALGQVFHFDADWRHSNLALQNALRSKLPQSLVLRSVDLVGAEFHARYGAKGKRYRYQILEGQALPSEVRYYWALSLNKPLNLVKMQQAAEALLGACDFSPFSSASGRKRNSCKENLVKTLWRTDWEQEGNRLSFITEGSGFLYKMVRTLVGTLVEIGKKKLSLEEFYDCLEHQGRSSAFAVAPARGLFLEEVFY